MKLNTTIRKISHSFIGTTFKKTIVLSLAIICLFSFSDNVNGQTYTINTYAGNGTAGYVGDAIAATAAELYHPEAVVVDVNGNIYFNDATNNRIRKINTAGLISTYAGNGTSVYNGDGIAANYAGINVGGGLAIDDSGNVYIGDFNSRIRKISTNGIISTIAGNGIAGYSGDGNAATAAEIGAAPAGLFVDGSGDVYIADLNNNRVRMVNASTGIITTVAGNGTAGYNGDGISATAAELNQPTGVYIDNFSDLYIADQINNRIRQVSSSGTISTIAGNGTGGYTGDGIAATAAEIWNPTAITFNSAGYIYITEYSSDRIRTITSSGLIATVAGNGTAGYNGDGIAATAAEINQPYESAVDNSGNIYIADNQNNRIRKINTSGIIATIAGNGTGAYNGDGEAATLSEFNDTYGMATDKAGNVYLADGKNNRVRKVSTSGIISDFAGNGTAGYSGDGGSAVLAELNLPEGVAIDNSGNVYISEVSNNRIRKVNTNGIISTFAGNGSPGYSGDGSAATNASLYAPAEIASDISGNLYIADSYNHRVRRINTSGTISTIAGNGNVGSTGDGGEATSAELAYPYGVTVDTKGNTYIGDANSSLVRMINSNGIISTIAGNGTAGYKGDGGPATAAEINSPVSLTSDAAGNIFIADEYNHCVRRVNSAGIISTIAGNGTKGYSGDGGPATSATMDTVSAVFADPSGNIYISDLGNKRVRKLTNSCTLTGNISTFTDVLCFGANTGSATVVAASGTTPYSYSWTPNGGTNATANNLAAGTYSVIVTDINGCAATASVNITQPPAITGSFNITNATCGSSNGQVILTAGGGTPPYIYAWSSGSISDTASKLPAGLYQVTIEDSYKCSAQLPVTITSSNGPTVTPNVTNVTCNGLSNGAINLTVTGSGPFTYNWSKGIANSCSAVLKNTSQNLTNLAAGTYQVIVTDAGGCTAILSVTVSQPSALSMTATTTNASCLASNGSAGITVNGGTSPYVYSWNNAATTTSATMPGIAAGAYPVVVTDNSGCKDSITVIVNNTGGPLVTIASITNTECGNSTQGALTISNSGGTTPYTYLWSNGASTSTLSNISAGSYYVTLTDKNGCKGIDTATVQDNAPLGVPICMVTVDTNQKNLIIWNRTGESKIQSYNVYRKVSTGTSYNLIGNVCATSLTEFFDSVANSQLISYTYELSEIDSCGKESPLSPSLNTIHLSVYPNVGSNSIKLVWDLYIGSFGNYYYIYRDTVQGKYTLYDSVPNTSVIWNDKNPLKTKDTVRYCVGIKGPQICNPTARALSINYNASKSNTGTVLFNPVGIQEIEAENSSLEVYPNPTNGEIELSINLANGRQNVDIKIFNALGEVLQTGEYTTVSGKLKKQLTLSSYSKGVYFVRVTTANGVMYRKVVLQ
ncbi:MAG TPA: T9SS type A sorting domain-containing protein [Bacteroidia bacterium]|nr:T9SS type A sorting domain-containing protein [Bacteroidia bacterium]